MHIGHNTAIGGDSNNLRILGFWIEREVQNPLLFTWLNQELDKEQIESQRLIDFPLVFFCNIFRGYGLTEILEYSLQGRVTGGLNP